VVTEFRLPELGENVAAGDVVRVLVAPGDVIAREQPVLELETDKATIEVPSSVAGQVVAVQVKAGDKVTVGQVILTIDESGVGAERGEGLPAMAAEERAGAERGAGASAELRRPAMASNEPRVRRGEAVDISRAVARPAPEPPAASRVEPDQEPAALVPAAPSVRRLARELGVDISRVAGSGPGGRIAPDDVKDFAKAVVSGSAGGVAPAVAAGPLPDFSRWGPVERRAMSGIRRKTAEHMSQAWLTVPHVTQHDQADITALEELRKRYAPQAVAAGGKLTITAVALKVVAAALKRFPQFNASVDMGAQEIVYKHYVHVGVAVDTERGLLVPVIRDVDRKGVIALSVELAQVSEKARARKLALEEMEGGSLTITNLGGIGGTAFSPIVNYPEVAILGLSRARLEPVFANGQFEPRLMMPVSLSYDHRVIDGADAARFLRFVAEAFEQPFVLAL
jgi:pyruvate dehydrogenase E2 component (dihydrolipoamide acetyltransferase)